MRWFKIYHGFCTDVKFAMIASDLQISRAFVLAIVVDLLEFASVNTPRGSIDGHDEEASAFNLGIDRVTVVTVRNALRNRGFVTGDTIANWEQYQKYDKTNQERQNRFRQAKKKQQVIENVTPRNALRNVSNALEERREDNTLRGASAKEALWSVCRSYLGESKMSLVGKWVKLHGEAKVYEAVISAQTKQVADPVSYVSKILDPVPFFERPENRMPSPAGG